MIIIHLLPFTFAGESQGVSILEVEGRQFKVVSLPGAQTDNIF